MTIYSKPTKVLMREFASELPEGKMFSRQEAVQWFAKRYPDIKEGTVNAHVDGMAVNSKSRKHHRSIKPGSGHDLFLKLGPGKYRLWDPNSDPSPVYPNSSSDSPSLSNFMEDGQDESADEEPSGATFAYEAHLRDFLARNLDALEPGLKLFDDEGLTGVEFDVGGRRIDILANDEAGNFVVIELKVSRGYDRAVGQLLRYMGWIERNLADGRRVRGIIVANEITEDLSLAASRVSDVQLAEYELLFKIRPVS